MFLILLYLIFMYDLLLKTDSLEILTMKYIWSSKKKFHTLVQILVRYYLILIQISTKNFNTYYYYNY